MYKLNIDVKSSQIMVVTGAMIQDFAEVSNDKNPIHLDDEYTQAAIFKKRCSWYDICFVYLKCN